MQSARYSRQILTKLEFSQQIFEKYSNTKFHENIVYLLTLVIVS